jgi:hypothetical protein
LGDPTRFIDLVLSRADGQVTEAAHNIVEKSEAKARAYGYGPWQVGSGLNYQGIVPKRPDGKPSTIPGKPQGAEDPTADLAAAAESAPSPESKRDTVNQKIAEGKKKFNSAVNGVRGAAPAVVGAVEDMVSGNAPGPKVPVTSVAPPEGGAKTIKVQDENGKVGSIPASKLAAWLAKNPARKAL